MPFKSVISSREWVWGRGGGKPHRALLAPHLPRGAAELGQPSRGTEGWEPHREFLLPPPPPTFVLGGTGKGQRKVEFGLGESRSSGLALQGQRMLGGDSSSSCPFILRAPAWPVTRHPIFNTSAPNCMKIGNSLQFLQIRCVQLPGLSPQGCPGGSLGPAPFLPKSSFGPWKKQENRMEKRKRGTGIPDHGNTRQRKSLFTWSRPCCKVLAEGDEEIFFGELSFPNSLSCSPGPCPSTAMPPKAAAPCPIPHSPKSPVLNPGEAARTSAWDPNQLWHPQREQTHPKILLHPQNGPSGAEQWHWRAPAPAHKVWTRPKCHL